MQQCRGTDGAGRAQRMTKRNRAAQWVHLVTIQPQIVDDCQALRRKGFVQFDPVEILLFQSNLLQRFRVSP